MSKTCIFCQLRNEERVIGECERTITFIDNYPVSSGHTLIIPKRHFPTYFEATDEELLALGKAVQNAKDILDKEFNADGYNIGINNGLTAGQSVMHLHIHLIPRYKDDVKDPKGGVRWVLKNQANYWDDKN
jgi:diadenosine tetraphosphate (Ap4A) HIT family hydrolase